MFSNKAYIALPSILSAVTILVLGGLQSCSRSISSEEIVISVHELPDMLIPVFRQNSAARMISDLLYQGLAGYTGVKPQELQLELADDIAQDQNDKSIYHILLKKDIQWHDGSSFKADDVVYTWNVICEQQNDSPLRGRLTDIIDGFEIENDYELTIDFRHPVPPDIALAILSFKIIPSHYNGSPMPTNLRVGSTGRDFAANPVGTGPCTFLERKSNTCILQSSSNLMSIRRITLKLQHDPDIAVANLIKGRTDIVFDVDPESFNHLTSNNLLFEEYEPTAFYALAINTNRKPLFDPVLREAIATAIDREATYLECFKMKNKRHIMRKPFPFNDHRLYLRFEDTQTYNHQLAGELVASSNYMDQKLTLVYPRMLGSVARNAALITARMLETVGVTVDVNEAGNNYYTFIAEGRYDIALVYEDFGRKYNHFDLYYSNGSRNVTRIADTNLDQLLLDWSNCIVMDHKFPLARQINSLLAQLNPYVYLFVPPARAYYSSRLQGVIIGDGNAVLKTLPQWTKVER